MNNGVTVHFAGRSLQYLGIRLFGQSQHIDGAQYRSLDGFNGIILVVDGRSRTSQIIDFVHICLIRDFHIMQYKLKTGIALQMSDISFRTGEKIIQTNHLMPVVYQSGTKMRTYKTSTATNQNFLHVMFFIVP